MKVLYLIILLSTFQLSCNRDTNAMGEEQYEVATETATVEMDDPSPPPTDSVSRFKTLQDWLHGVCNDPGPAKPIATLEFGLFESEKSLTLCLTGTNTYEVSENLTQIRIDFSPVDMYYTIPPGFAKGLTHNQVRQKLASELKAFTTTSQFRHSFFSQANSVVTNWNGEELWTNSSR